MLLKSVIKKQINLIVEWFRVGFIHGVMNTDNMSIIGETIDYGPCSFMNAYNPRTVFSSIDTNGRYAFGNQSRIGHWNLSVFASLEKTSNAIDRPLTWPRSIDGFPCQLIPIIGRSSSLKISFHFAVSSLFVEI